MKAFRLYYEHIIRFELYIPDTIVIKYDPSDDGIKILDFSYDKNDIKNAMKMFKELEGEKISIDIPDDLVKKLIEGQKMVDKSKEGQKMVDKSKKKLEKELTEVLKQQ